MKTFLATPLLLLSTIVLGQNTIVKKEYKFANGYTIKKDGSIELGNQSTEKGYKYIKGLKKSNEVNKGDKLVIKHIAVVERPYEDDQVSIRGWINDDKCYAYFYPAFESEELIVPDKYKEGLKPRHFDPRAIPLEDGEVVYQEILSLDGFKKDKIFEALKLTIIETYVDAKEVIQHEDKDVGNIVAKGFTQTTFRSRHYGSYGQDVRYWYILNIDVKDNKCRIRITNTMCQTYIPSTTYTIGSWSDKISIASVYVGYLNEKEKNEKKIRGTRPYNILKEYHIEMRRLLQSLQSDIEDNLEDKKDDW